MPAAVDELDGDLIDTASRVCHRAAQDEDAFWRRVMVQFEREDVT
jgi:hypothetical protein